MAKSYSINIDLSKKLSEREKAAISKMTQDETMAYLLSKVGYKPSKPELRSRLADIRESISKESKKYSGPIVRSEPNHFLNLLKTQFKLGKSIPQDSNRYYGIEIECLIPFSSMDMEYYDYENSSECECPSCEGSGEVEFHHRDSGESITGECPSCEGSGNYESDESGWNENSALSDAQRFFSKQCEKLRIRGLCVKLDGSIDTNGDTDLMPLELTILVRQDDLSNLEKLCELLSELEATVNASCGLHVHIDSRGKSQDEIQTIATRFSRSLPFISKIVPKSRRNNRFCQLGVSSIKLKSSEDRYYAVNLTSFEKHGTIEIRLHSATTNYEKISSWVKILSTIYSKDMPSRSLTWESFHNYLDDKSLSDYITKRRELFDSEFALNEESMKTMDSREEYETEDLSA